MAIPITVYRLVSRELAARQRYTSNNWICQRQCRRNDTHRALEAGITAGMGALE